jgi:hypothetical protein
VKPQISQIFTNDLADDVSIEYTQRSLLLNRQIGIFLHCNQLEAGNHYQKITIFGRTALAGKSVGQKAAPSAG